MSNPLEDRFWAKVNKTEGCWTWTAAADPNGYGQIKVQGRLVGAHRLSFMIAYGAIAEGLEVDHKCHNRSCVNPSHLRAATSKQNGENLAGAYSNSKSGVRGVSWHARDKKWRAEVGHGGQRVNLGYFASIQEAEAAVVAKRLELFTHNDMDRAA